MAVDPVTLTQELVRCRSVTPADAGAQGLLQTHLEAMGFACQPMRFGKIDNLFARIGTDGPHFCFCGHTDVVPPGDESAWTHPPFAAAIADGRIYGRGTADMKANIAAFVAGLSRYLGENGPPNGSISLIITGDEEAEAVDGTVRVLQWMDETGQLPDVTLVGEPTNPNILGEEIKIGRRGSLSGRLTVDGVQGHVAYPDRADNPIPKLTALLHELQRHRFDEGSEHFTATNLEVTSVDVGNAADNVIPARATAKFNVRFNEKWTAQSLEAEIRGVLDRASAAYSLTCASNAESFLTQPGPFTTLVQDAVEHVTGRRPALTTTGGTSDARFVAPYGAVVEFGLINQTIHKTDEHVDIGDLCHLTEIYRQILQRYFAG